MFKQIKNVYNTQKQLINLAYWISGPFLQKALFVNELINDHNLDLLCFDRKHG